MIDLDDLPRPSDGFTPEAMVVYGPPTSRRGRFQNWLRRRIGWEEQDEIYGYWRNMKDFQVTDKETVEVQFGEDGVVYFLDEQKR